MHSRKTNWWRPGAWLLISMGLSRCHQGDSPPATVVSLSSPSRLLQRGLSAPAGYYSVQPGDTLWLIAQRHAAPLEVLAKNNGLTPPYRLYPGQLIKLDNAASSVKLPRGLSQTPVEKPQRPPNKLANTRLPPAEAKPTAAVSSISTPAAICQAPQWHWPTQGKIIEPFSPADGGNRGIDITGQQGQAIYSSAEGRVVYAGNALHGYGHLLIIKHNEDWLSAYAHNDRLLVREQQAIKAGQKIATMGRSGTHSVRLHFEIRHKGKSVNPLRYLPQR